MSVAAFGRVLRTLGGKYMGKCRLRAHQHPLLPPLSNRCGARPHAKHPRQDASSTRDERVLGGDVLRMRAEDRLIRASILDFRAKLENRCRVLPVYALIRASILDFKPKLENRCRGEWFRLLQPSLPPQRSASDSNLRSVKEEWFRLLRSWRQRSSASDSNLRSVKEERFRLLRSWRQRSSASRTNFPCGKEEWFRLQRAWRTQAGTGFHEGGIILS